MFYTSFVVITSTPGLLATFLVSRNIIKQVTNPIDQSTSYVGVLPGMEWVKVPTPIQTAPASGIPMEPGYVPPTYDTRAVFLVKFSHGSEAEQEADGDMTTVDAEGKVIPVNQFDWSKFGKWVKANSSVAAAPANYLINGQPAGSAYKITGQQVWLVRDAPERFGVWQ